MGLDGGSRKRSGDDAPALIAALRSRLAETAPGERDALIGAFVARHADNSAMLVGVRLALDHLSGVLDDPQERRETLWLVSSLEKHAGLGHNAVEATVAPDQVLDVPSSLSAEAD